jgi:uncharacterized LabA/DUF88 family protein
MAVHGTRHRESVSWNYAGLLQFLGTMAGDRTGLPMLRCYWYEATVEGRRSAEHDALADLPGVKLRLGRMRPGRREGVESEIHRDLATLARNGAIRDAVVVSAEEDLTQVIADVQDLGLRVTLVHITVDGNWTISRLLRQECDDIVEIGEAHLRPYVELVVGAEPLRDDERNAVGSHSGRALTNGHRPVGPLGPQPALPVGSHTAPPEIYTAPVIAEYQRAAQPAINGQPGSPQPANLSGPAAQAAMPPAQQAMPPAAQQSMPTVQPTAALSPSAPASGPMPAQQALPQPAAAPGMAGQAGPQPSPPIPQQAGSPAAPGVQAGQTVYPAPPTYQGPAPDAQGGSDVPGRGPGRRRQAGPRQARAAQPAPASASLPGSVTGPIGPSGPAPAPAGGGQNMPGAQNMPAAQGMPAAPGMPGGAVDPAALPAQQARGGVRTYPATAPTGRFTPGQQQAQQYPGPPADRPAGGPAVGYVPQPQAPYGGPQPGASHQLVPQQTSVSLADAVQAAHGEGFSFGQSVANEAPALWLEAVLARKPRMPSDLEARLLQDSALPIDSLLHDEVRHALRRGFWDALERARH